MSQRTERVDELLRQEIGALLSKEVQDPRIGFATITDVETSPDLRHAKVWVSVIGQKADRDETLRALSDAMPFIRHELGKRLRIQRIPDLHVRLDDTAERGTRILHLLHELEAGTDPDAIEPIDEILPTPVRRLPHEGDADDALGAAAREASGSPDGAPVKRRSGYRRDGYQPGGPSKGSSRGGAKGGSHGGRPPSGGGKHGAGPRPRP
jgi:ribosome-binding factor A